MDIQLIYVLDNYITLKAFMSHKGGWKQSYPTTKKGPTQRHGIFKTYGHNT
jgi:hypothetical protein